MLKNKFVIDSSVIVKWLNQKDEANIDKSDQIAKDIVTGKIDAITTELAKYEVMNAMIFGKKLNTEEVQIPLKTLFSIPLMYSEMGKSLMILTYEIASRNKITFYDASFVALAFANNAVLVTDNPKHQGKVKEVKVVALKDYLQLSSQ